MPRIAFDSGHFCLIVISYQEILGNYNIVLPLDGSSAVISYQEILGNYNLSYNSQLDFYVISYQEILGNYNR